MLRWRNRWCCALFQGICSYCDVLISFPCTSSGSVAFVPLRVRFFRRAVEFCLCRRFGTHHFGGRGRGPPFGGHGWSDWRADWPRQTSTRDWRGLNRRRNQNHWVRWKCHVRWCAIWHCRDWAWRCLATWWKPKRRGSHIEMLLFNRESIIVVFGISFVHVIWPWNPLLYDCQRAFRFVIFFIFL